MSERRLAENEVIFRALNQEVKDFVLEDASDTVYAKRRLRFYCECSNMDCRERIVMPAKEYDDLHTNQKQFVVKAGHTIPEVENIMSKHGSYWVIEKRKVPPLPEDIDPQKFF